MKFIKFQEEALEFFYSKNERLKLPFEITAVLPFKDYKELIGDVFEFAGVIPIGDVPQDDVVIKHFLLPNGIAVHVVEADEDEGVSWQVGPPESDQKNFKSVPVKQAKPDFSVIEGYKDEIPAIAMQTLPIRA